MTKARVKEFTVTAELGAVIGTGFYENERIRLTESVTYECENSTESDREKIREEMTKRLYLQIEHQEIISRQKALEKRYADIRWYSVDGNGKYPSVTSVIDTVNPIEWHVDENKLRGLAARGNVLDTVLQKYIEIGEWLQPGKIPEALKDFNIMKKEGYQIEGDLSGFVEKYAVKFETGHVRVVNHKYKYAGELDCICRLDGSDKLTLADLKGFNPDKEGKLRVGKQLAAYAKAYEEQEGVQIEQLAVFPIHGGTKQGFSKPLYVNDIDKAFELFLADRAEFTNLFKV